MGFSHYLQPLNLVWRRTTLDYVLEGYFVKEVLLAGLGRPVRQFAVDDNQNIQLGGDLLFVTFGLDMVKPFLKAVENGCRNLGVLHLGDEYGRDDHSFYARADYVLRNYWFSRVVQPVGLQSTPVLWVPNGYRTGLGPIDPTRTLPFGHRTIEGFFSGVLNEDSPQHERAAMAHAVKQAKLPFVVAGTSGFAQGLGPVAYGGYLGNSKFALVPAGNSPETLRLYEALEHGAIPVMLKSEFVFAGEALGAIGRPPLVLLDQWSSLPKAYADLTAAGPVRMEERRREVLNWWTRFKEHQQNRVRDVIEASFAKTGAPRDAMKTAALVTLALGEKHLAYWRRHCEASWHAYTRAYGYDMIVVTQPLDASPLAASRAPAWQKCLACSQPFVADYRQIVLLDCDILINPASPPITDQLAEQHIGGVIAGSHLHPDHRALLLSEIRGQRVPYAESADRLREDQAAYYESVGLAPVEAGIVQTGVLVASPQHHRSIFESVYQLAGLIDHRTFEQVPLSHAILSSGLFRPIDTRFNSVFYETMRIHYPYLNDTKTPSYEVLASAAVQAAYFNSFFLHFAYIPHFIDFFPPLPDSAGRQPDCLL